MVKHFTVWVGFGTSHTKQEITKDQLIVEYNSLIRAIDMAHYCSKCAWLVVEFIMNLDNVRLKLLRVYPYE